MRKTYYVAAWSGGKDSTYMIDELLRRGDKLDEIVFCDTGYEFDIMYDYIERMEKYWNWKFPDLKITKLNWGDGKKIWKRWSNTKFTKGQYVGQMRGFPFHMGMSWCTREMKVNPMKKYLKSLDKENIIEYIGIASDEPKRVRDTGERYPMVEWGVTEREAAEILVERGLHNPLYNHFHRTGCFHCPKQSLTSLYKLWVHYPKEWNKIVKMQKKYIKKDAGVWEFKGYHVDELIEKFKKYELKGKPTNYLDEEQELGCMCK